MTPLMQNQRMFQQQQDASAQGMLQLQARDLAAQQLQERSKLAAAEKVVSFYRDPSLDEGTRADLEREIRSKPELMATLDKYYGGAELVLRRAPAGAKEKEGLKVKADTMESPDYQRVLDAEARGQAGAKTTGSLAAFQDPRRPQLEEFQRGDALRTAALSGETSAIGKASELTTEGTLFAENPQLGQDQKERASRNALAEAAAQVAVYKDSLGKSLETIRRERAAGDAAQDLEIKQQQNSARSLMELERQRLTTEYWTGTGKRMTVAEAKANGETISRPVSMDDGADEANLSQLEGRMSLGQADFKIWSKGMQGQAQFEGLKSKDLAPGAMASIMKEVTPLTYDYLRWAKAAGPVAAKDAAQVVEFMTKVLENPEYAKQPEGKRMLERMRIQENPLLAPVEAAIEANMQPAELAPAKKHWYNITSWFE